MQTFVVIIECEYPDGPIDRLKAFAKHAADVQKKLDEVSKTGSIPLCTPICAHIGLVGTMIQYTVNQ